MVELVGKGKWKIHALKVSDTIKMVQKFIPI
jgi:hypothetical protein